MKGRPSIARYIAALRNDPFYRQQVADLQAANVADSAGLSSGILNSLVQRGEVPNFAAAADRLGLSPQVARWIANHVDLANASALASQGNAAGTSQQGQLDLAHRTAVGGIKDSLAARGMLQSGATPQMMGSEAQNYKVANFTADQSLLGYINGAFAAFAKNRSARARQRGDALQQAYQRNLSTYGTAYPPKFKAHQAVPAQVPAAAPESYENYNWNDPPSSTADSGGGGRRGLFSI